MEGLKPFVRIEYMGRDVTGDFEPILSGVAFRDYLDGRAGEVDIDLLDSKGLFLADWYPDIDDRIEVWMGFRDGNVMRCGLFWVDEIKLTGGSGGDSCSIRGLSLPSSLLYAPEVRFVHESRPLREVVTQEADRLGYKVVGDLSGTYSGLQIESGLAFLCRVAHETGRILKVEDDTLVFYQVDEILRSGAAIEIDRADIISYDVTDKASGRISKCTVKWWDRQKKKQITGSHDAKIKGGGSVVIWQEVESVADAQKKAADYIKDRNKKGLEFSFTMTGDVRLQAGVSVLMTGFGRFDGFYFIGEIRHTITDGGYTVQVTLQKPEKK